MPLFDTINGRQVVAELEHKFLPLNPLYLFTDEWECCREILDLKTKKTYMVFLHGTVVHCYNPSFTEGRREQGNRKIVVQSQP
jgi:hypothetical protein